MSAIALLLGLFLLSYVGSSLVGKRVIAGFGLPSGAEYLVLGFLLGPHALGIISRSLLASFEPLLVVGAAWIALCSGLTYTLVGERRIRPLLALLGVLGTLLVLAVTGGATWLALPFVRVLEPTERLLVAGGVGVVSCGCTRQAVRWVVERYAASGPLSDVLADQARASAFVPVFGVSLLLAAFPSPALAAVPLEARVAITWCVGGLLALVAFLLVERGLVKDEVWGIIVGTSLLVMGVSARLGLSAVASAFALGLCLGVLSRRRRELAAMLRPTERGVLLPLALLAGALVNLREAPGAALCVPLAIAARLGAELVRGAGLWLLVPRARPAGLLIGQCFSSTGEVSLACAVSLALSLRTPLAQTVLVVAVANVLTGELLAPLALRRALARAGELAADSSLGDRAGAPAREEPAS